MRPDDHSAVIFDVDGPLLDLTPAEEDAFFAPFRDLHGLEGLSRDWDSYAVRNDLEICREILAGHFGRPPDDGEMQALSRGYFRALTDALNTGAAEVSEIAGARGLVQTLHGMGGIALGTATANFREAARIRLDRVGLWSYLRRYPGAADEGGAKREVLARVVAELGLPKDRIVFLGDNLNDLDAGLACGVHFIGFHVEEPRRARLAKAGAKATAGDHGTSLALIRGLLGLD